MEFTEAHAFTAKWEGGLVDDPADPGGVTKYGVSLRWLKSIGYDVDDDGDVDAADIRALTPGQAAELFKSRFWDACRLGSLPPASAVTLYDAIVNTGPSQAVKFTQRACNFYPGYALSVDGALGPKTRSAVLSIAKDSASDLVFAARCLKARREFHVALAQAKPALAKFLKGWLGRVSALEKHITFIRPN